MRRGTAASLQLTVDPKYLLDSSIQIWIKQEDLDLIELSPEEYNVEGNSGHILITLSEETTLKLRTGKPTFIQVGGIRNRNVWRSSIEEIYIKNTIYNDLIGGADDNA